jgi:hypothetical protein
VFLSRSDEETVGRIALQKGQCGTAESDLGEIDNSLMACFSKARGHHGFGAILNAAVV